MACFFAAACNPRAEDVVRLTRSVSAEPSSLPVAPSSAVARYSRALSASGVPRPIYPQSGATLLGANVVFRWAGEQAHVELARERSFKTISQRSPDGAGSGLVLHLDRGIWFWRVVGASGTASAVWGFDVTLDSRAPHAPSVLLGPDYNCDLFADLSVQYGVVLGRTGKLPENPITALDVGALRPPELLRAPTDQPYIWSFPEATGDVNGDGCADMTARVARQSSTRLEDDIPVRMFFMGGPAIHSTWAAMSRISHSAIRIGDVNDDGYADVADCGSVQDARCAVYAGGPEGLHDQPLFDLPHYDRLLGGTDLNGDDHSDLVGASKDGQIAFYAGPLNAAPSAPTQTWKVLPPLSAFVGLADLDNDGHVDIWGKGSIARERTPGIGDTSVWMITGKDLADGRPPRTLGSFKWEMNDDMVFVPGVGKRGAGILVRSTDIWSDFAFVQESFPFALRSSIGFRPRLESHFSESKFESSGDFNGDGWNDLLVTRVTPAEDVGSEIYLGGAKPFTLHSPTDLSDTGDPYSGGFASGGAMHYPF